MGKGQRGGGPGNRREGGRTCEMRIKEGSRRRGKKGLRTKEMGEERREEKELEQKACAELKN